jgi:hypothetical protein
MDPRLFHPKSDPRRRFRTMDRFNSWTGLNSCGFLNSIGWYYTSLPTLLLGHYRSFHLYQKYHSGQGNNAALINGYILRSQTDSGIKNNLSLFKLLFYTIWDYPVPKTSIYTINQRLLHEQAPILHEFLSRADSGFEEALDRAISQIDAPTFLGIPNTYNTLSQNVLVQVKQDYNTNNYHTSYSHNELNIHPVIKEEAPAKEPSVPPNDIIRGKEKDVFSKKQVLILLDLLSQSTKIESFNLRNPNQHEPLALFLHALTGKSIETWLEELKSYRNKDLYAFRDAGDFEYLVKTLTNLSNTLRTAGLKTLTKQVNNKISELKAKR